MQGSCVWRAPRFNSCLRARASKVMVSQAVVAVPPAQPVSGLLCLHPEGFVAGTDAAEQLSSGSTRHPPSWQR